MADLAGSKIQIMNGAGTNLFPRNRTVDIVDKAGNAVFDASTQQVKAAYLPSYVDDVLEVQYLGSSSALPAFASASHAGKWMYSTSNNKMYSGTTTAWAQKDWETGKIYVDVNGDAVEGTYRWTGTKPVKITEAPIAVTGDVRPWTAAGTAEATLVPTELAVATAINSGVTSAITKTKADIGKVVNSITGTNPIGRNQASGNVTISLNYGTADNNGVALKLANTTSIIASAALATGTSTGKGTVATLGKLDAYGAGATASAVVFSLSAWVSGTNTSAMTSTYLVPSIKLFHDVMSKAVGEYKDAVSSITQTGTTVTYTRLDGTTGSYTCASATYATTAGNGGVKSLTSKTDGIALNATTGAINISGVAMTAATANAAGKLGMVQAPAGANTKFLRGDYTWQTISIPGVPISGVVGITPVSTVTNNKVTSVHLHYGTGDNNGVALKLANTTSIIASATLATGTSAGKGTVATLGKFDAYGNGSQAVFSLSAFVSGTDTSAMTSTYLVPSIKLFHDVMSNAAGEYKNAISSITQAGATVTYTRLDGTTGSYTCSSATYATTAANGGVKSLTSKTDGLALNATTGAIQISGVAFTSANASTAGKMGMVPAPAKGDQAKFLRADATWQAISIPGVPISGVVGITPVSTVTNNKVTSVHLHYGTGSTYGVYLGLANTTSLVAKGKLTDGTSAGYGTVATLGKLDAYGNGSQAVFSLSAWVSGTNTSAMTSTYLVPSIKLLHDVASAAATEYKAAVKSIDSTTGNTTINYTKLDGTTGSFKYQNTTYTAVTGANIISNTDTAGLLNPKNFNSKIVQSMGVTGTTDMWAANQATATSLYVPSQRAILNNCLFYSTIA